MSGSSIQSINHSVQLLDLLIIRISKLFSSNVDKYYRFHGLEFAKCLTVKNPKPLLSHKRFSKALERFTVIRSPFIFKKTRSQFKRFEFGCIVVINVSKIQQLKLIEWLVMTKFSAELKIISVV